MARRTLRVTRRVRVSYQDPRNRDPDADTSTPSGLGESTFRAAFSYIEQHQTHPSWQIARPTGW